MLLNDGVRNHPKVLAAGAEAAWLWAAAIDYCRDQLTDGFVPTVALSGLGRFKTPIAKLATACLAAGLFEAAVDGIRVHDFLKHNDSKASVEQKRRDNKTRQKTYRDRHQKRDHNAPVATLRNATVTCNADTSCIDVDVDVGVGSLEGKPERKPSWVAADFWDLWCETANLHGAKQPNGHTPGEFEHIRVLMSSYTGVELREAVKAWWKSPHTNGRNLGLFRSQIGELFEYLASGSALLFRAPKLRVTAATRPHDGVRGGSTCPHEPMCDTVRACIDLALQQGREERARA